MTNPLLRRAGAGLRGATRKAQPDLDGLATVEEAAILQAPLRPSEADGIAATLAERGSRYGDFTDHAAIAQAQQDILRAQVGWEKLTAVQKQSLTVICDKIARILSGDPNYADNWHDIQGYAKLAEDRLPKD